MESFPHLTIPRIFYQKTSNNIKKSLLHTIKYYPTITKTIITGLLLQLLSCEVQGQIIEGGNIDSLYMSINKELNSQENIKTYEFMYGRNPISYLGTNGFLKADSTFLHGVLGTVKEKININNHISEPNFMEIYNKYLMLGVGMNSEDINNKRIENEYINLMNMLFSMHNDKESNWQMASFDYLIPSYLGISHYINESVSKENMNIDFIVKNEKGLKSYEYFSDIYSYPNKFFPYIEEGKGLFYSLEDYLNFAVGFSEINQSGFEGKAYYKDMELAERMLYNKFLLYAFFKEWSGKTGISPHIDDFIKRYEVDSYKKILLPNSIEIEIETHKPSLVVSGLKGANISISSTMHNAKILHKDTFDPTTAILHFLQTEEGSTVAIVGHGTSNYIDIDGRIITDSHLKFIDNAMKGKRGTIIIGGCEFLPSFTPENIQIIIINTAGILGKSKEEIEEHKKQYEDMAFLGKKRITFGQISTMDVTSIISYLYKNGTSKGITNGGDFHRKYINGIHFTVFKPLNTSE